MTNRARSEYDTSFSSQLPTTLSVPSSINIPQFHATMVNLQGTDFIDSKEGSTHTTPLNYMRRSTPMAALRKVEQINERDPYHGGDLGEELEIERRFDTMNLTSAAADDFFQFQKGNDSLHELEPALHSADREGEYQGSNNKNWKDINHVSNSSLDIGSVTNRRYGAPNELLLGQHSGGAYETNYQQELRGNRETDIHLSQHHPQGSASSGASGSYLVTPPGYSPQGEDTGALSYKNQPNSSHSTHSSSSSNYNMMTPRESWSPSGSHQQQSQPHLPSQHVSQAQQMQGQQIQGQHTQGPQMHMQNRRPGPATPSLLSSYATANAQPNLTPSSVVQNKYLSAPVPQAEYGQQSQYRAPLDDYNRRPQQDRMPYGGRGGGLPMPVPNGGGYFPPAPHAPHSQYGGMAQVPPMYGQQGGMQQHHGNPMANYYPANSPAAALMPVQPDFIYQVQFKRTAKSFTNRSGTQIAERDFVVVEGDRGEDIGVVIEVMSMQEFMHRRMHEYRVSSDKDNHSVDCILRLATTHERQQLPDKFQAEKNIIQSCNELAMYGFGLPIMVYDAEFQFDRNKLTIYYECNVRIDFRDFVRQLYSTYKARIWMKIGNINTPLEVQPLAAMALATGVQFSNGTSGVC